MAFYHAVLHSASSAVARSLGRNLLSHHFTAALHHRAAGGLLSRLAIGSKSELVIFPQRYLFSALASKPASDAELVTVIESQIKCAEECYDHDRVEETREGFPFEIQDDKGKNMITLRRKYEAEDIDEDIVVKVGMTRVTEEVRATDDEEGGGDKSATESDDDKGNKEGGGDKSATQSGHRLTVSIKKREKTSIMEFICTAYPEKFVINSVLVKEDSSKDADTVDHPGSDYQDVNEEQYMASHAFLERRGVAALTASFFREYMANKESRENLQWLKCLKEFVEK